MNQIKERTSNRIKRKKDEDYFVQSSCFWYYVRTTIMIKFGRRHGPFFRHEINNTKKGSSSGNVARKRINEFLCGSLVNDR